jgi:hypothetical protein
MAYTLTEDIDLAYTLEEGIKSALAADHRLRTTTTVLEEGDAAAQLTGWTLTGVTYSNSQGGVLYWKLANVAATRTVYLYSDQAKTAKVAQGSRSGDGVIALTARNSSGITGGVTVAYTVNDDDTDNRVSVNLLGIKEHLKEYIPMEEYDIWASKQCPLLTVVAVRNADERVALGMHEVSFACRIETRMTARDVLTLRRTEKRILDNVRSFLWFDRTDDGSRFNGVLDSGDGSISEIETEYVQGVRHDPDSGSILDWFAAGSVTFLVRLHVETP